jgi:hypothetical protein
MASSGLSFSGWRSVRERCGLRGERADTHIGGCLRQNCIFSNGTVTAMPDVLDALMFSTYAHRFCH